MTTVSEMEHTIVVIGDDAGLTRLICTALRRKGLSYLTFAAGKDAVEAVCTQTQAR